MTFTTDKFRLDGKVAIVTGAGGRGNSIGRAYATGLAAAGASVVTVDLNGDGAAAVAAEIVEAGGRAIGVQADIADRASVEAMAARAIAEFGGIDILVNNAALMVEISGTPILEMKPEAIDRTLSVNLIGALNCIRSAAPSMRERGGGRIVNQLSAGAFPATSVYGVSKTALLGLTLALARELGPDKITCNAIAPGHTMSDAGAALTPSDGEKLKAMESRVVMRLLGEPDELVGALLLLASEAGAWITGQTINIDGGRVLRN
jgi:NAD(P)-dependent dehydrogenase (short-subunit alcohol dehydrogenase family)